MADGRSRPVYQRSASSSLDSPRHSRSMADRRPNDAAARGPGPRVRVTRAFSQIEEPATLQELQELLAPTSKKTLDVRRLVSPARTPGMQAQPPPTSPASLPVPRTSLRKQATGSSDGSSITGSPQSAAWGRMGLPPRNASTGRDEAPERRRKVSIGRAEDATGSLRRHASMSHADGAAAAEPRRDSSEWADTAARLNRRVQELEAENFRLKTGKEPPKSFAGGELRTLRTAESDVGDSSQKRRASLNKSRSCANGFGLTVAEAAAASHRTRTRRLASVASATEASVKLRSGYWNGANNVKSSFSCNNLADLEQPEFMLEKLRTFPPPIVAASTTANGGNKNGTAPSTATAAPSAHETSRKSDSFQRTSSETEEDIASMRSQHFALKSARKNSSVVAQQSSSSAAASLDEDFDEPENRITSPRSYFEAGLRTGSLSIGPTASPALKTGKRASGRDVRVWVGTWNMGAADPFDDGKGIIDEQRSATMLQNFLPHGYQLYVLGVQEGVSENVYHAVEAYLNRNERGARYYRMEMRNSNFMVNHKNHPPDAVIDAVHGRGDGAFVGTKFTGMAVFYCADIQDKVKLIRAGAHKFKLTSGSKGGVAVALMINHTTIVFVNCHLDARNDTYRREQIRNLNASLGRVMGHYSFDLTEQFHHVVWMGDMNYRIVLLDPQMVLHMLEEGRNLELHDKFDGLLNDRRNGGVFEGFTEPHKFPDFYPTYKKFPKRGPVNEMLPLWPSLVWRVLYKEPFYKGGKVKKRVPGWCDRILIHSLLVSDSKLIPEKVPDPTSREVSPRLIDNYRSVNHGDGMDVSDHSPVYGTFILSFPQQDSDVLTSGSPRKLTRRNSRSFSTASGISDEARYSNAVSGSYFDQARVVRQMKAQNRPVSTVLRVFNMVLVWGDSSTVVPKKTRIVAPLVGEDSKQCDVIGERCQGSNGLNLSLNAVIQHTRPLEQLHMLVWVKNESVNGHCTLSLKRVARMEEGGEVKYRVPLYNDSMRVHLDGHPLLVVFSVRSKTFAK
ncbi:hypothetical protein PHYPSEUDO_003522 [Phytophthora pseudosyringae]|uniref:Inositol polyphosphate-related phosphatase domain-containing protein n=1 Tax=Phytophthora pseudosyringae TaxID=221518 RepID=A0A8T1VRM6_9STRA|nr:hypothetical protein PHYPSEUDO_003522 [Phytophthora pseudosyringae]